MDRGSRTLIGSILVSMVFLSWTIGLAPKAAASQVEPRLKHVALFKNGLGFFISEITVPDEARSFDVKPTGAPCHGTCWLVNPPNVKIDSLIAKEIKTAESGDALSLSDLLRANLGRKVTVYVSDIALTGVLSFLPDPPKQPVPRPYAPGMWMEVDSRNRSNNRQRRLLILDTADGDVAIDPQSVNRIECPGEQLERTVALETQAVRFSIDLAAPAMGQSLTLGYLSKGVTWAPSYMVDVSETANAHVSAKAVVMNEVCDWDGVSVGLVTGFPNLQFCDVVSPLALKEDLAEFLRSLTEPRSESRRSRRAVVMQQRVGWSDLDMSGMMPEYGSAGVGMVAEDLFIYPVGHISLAKGDVAYLPLFTESVPYEHIYKWEIPDYVNEDDRYAYRRGSDQEGPREEEVWHCLRMTNDTQVPWTTAPAQIVKESVLLGQDTLTYTPAKGKTDLRITRAVNIKAEQMELEKDRQRDALQMYGHHYDLITVAGKLSVTNYQPKPISLEVTKMLSGEITDSQPQAEIKDMARGLHRMNGIKKLTWTISLQPQENKTLDYTYDVYVRR